MFLLSGTLSPDEWDAAYLYMAFVLRKVSGKALDKPVHIDNTTLVIMSTSYRKIVRKKVEMVFLVNFSERPIR